MQDLRTTTGQRISIGYDPAANVLTFREDNWHTYPFRASSTPTVTRLANVPTLKLARRISPRRRAQKATRYS